jgi:hypothetical protein
MAYKLKNLFCSEVKKREVKAKEFKSETVLKYKSGWKTTV